MAAAIPSSEPTSFVAGDTIAWTKSLADYFPADGWILSYALRLQNGSGLQNVTATTSGTSFAATITAADSAKLTPGIWLWAAYVTKASERYQVDTGSVTILPNLAAIDHQIDLRSDAKIAYDNALAAWKTFGKAKMVVLNGRTYTERDAADLIVYVDRCRLDYNLELAAQQQQDTGVDPRHIGVRLARV